MAWFSRFFTTRSAQERPKPQLFFHNTLSDKKELFIPLKPGRVSMYSCGPTVYNRQHIGNLRGNVFSDTIARTLEGAGYYVRRVTNITDVGHLVSDEDEGEDKMALGAAREKKSPDEIATRYTKLFKDDLAELNVAIEDIEFPRATEYIKEQIALAKTLEEKGFAYRLPDGLYFDIEKFPGYGKLGGIHADTRPVRARIGAVAGKKNPHDFALWRTAKPHDLQQWDSPWGRGNPGWHIECSAMIRALLGPEIDIHTGGEDLVSVHHNDEIAQSEAAGSRTFVRYWMHNAFLTMNGDKISKSLGNVVYLSDVVAKGYAPLALRYFFLQAHYRTPMSFSWDALAAANEALSRLERIAREVQADARGRSKDSPIRDRFLALIRDDLATPQAIGSLWESLKSEDYTPEEKWGLIEDADLHLGLSLINDDVTAEPVPAPVLELLAEREKARAGRDFASADRLRALIERSGYRVEDGPNGAVLTKRVR